jgi:hypothetical protein
MNRNLEIFLVLMYNLALVAGTSYLIVAHDFSAWTYLLALIFAASWNKESPVSIEMGK